MADLQPRDEPGERGLGGIGRAAEHRFAEESATEAHSIDPADEVAAVPAFDRMGVTRGEQAERGAFDIGVDPGLGAVGAAVEHGGEVAVDGHRELPRAEPPRERARAMEAVQGNDRADAGLDPENVVGIAAVGHREHPDGIASKQ